MELSGSDLPSMKTLGVMWEANEDVFTFSSKLSVVEKKPTKRSVLKKIASLFDPLGFLSPFTIRAKMCMQDIWITGIEWDEFLPDQLAREIGTWFSELKELQNVKISRGLHQREKVVKSVLHTFGDASQKEYGAVVYMRSEYEDQTVSVNFVAARTRVAPLQSISILRLELLGAIVGTRLTQAVNRAV